ncbi:unnamed protein product [Candida verbasci]|uniref:Ribophorin II C-terminal domain-containing protein n=1 Tax=Candida verbasci TaxID=1227364 RepID=A0A9W4TWE8_9ASCO|nr:unnamed protein product [Candida verbasci]
MKLSSILFLFSWLSLSIAFTLTGTIKLNKQKITYGEIETKEIKQIYLNSPKDTIEINLSSKEINEKPEQIMFSLSDSKQQNLVTHYVPSVSNSKIKLSIKSAQLPEVLKIKDSLLLNLIIADKEVKFTKFLLEIIPTSEFKETSNYKSKSKIGIQPEIHHIFKADESTVNPIIPLVFISVAVVLFLGLVSSWVGFIGVNNLFKTFKTISTGQLLQNVAFLISLIGFELNFIKYYFGQSIFTTLFYGFILLIPSIYFGTSVLRFLSKNRKIGK